ncbi:MAG: DUF4625 domain-containing protein [Flavobacteriales bacterium]|nr:DUF4625 domain-containing protein [Flavobacteriales bacterium]
MKVKQIFGCIIMIIIMVACKKETPADNTVSAPVLDDENPSLTLSSPADNLVLELGQNLNIEGLAVDNHQLGLFTYVLETIDTPSHHFNLNGAIPLSGNHEDFIETLSIPDSAAVGNYRFEAYAEDSSGNVSDQITYSFEMLDKIPSVIISTVDSVDFGTHFEIKAYTNTYGVVNRFQVFDKNSGILITEIKDNCGFKIIQFDIHFDNNKARSNIVDLNPKNEQVNNGVITFDYAPTYPSDAKTFVITLIEFDSEAVYDPWTGSVGLNQSSWIYIK